MMRITTMLGAVALTVSSAALAQVASRPAEQKTAAPDAGANDMAPMADAATANDNAVNRAAPSPTPTPVQADGVPATAKKPAGDPTAASDAPRK